MFLSLGIVQAKGTVKDYSVKELLCENLVNPLGIDNVAPHFSWKIASNRDGAMQTAYQIEVGSDSVALAQGNADLWQTGKVKSADQVMVPYGGKALSSRSLCYWRVRSWDEKGKPSAWSNIVRFSVGLLKPSDFAASYIGMDKAYGDLHAPLLRKDVTLDAVGTCFLHVNSLGYHEVYVNGKKVGKNVLTPAVSQLTMRSQIVTYDVSSYLHRGNNTIVLWIGQGWYKPTTFKAQYDGALVKAELDVLKDGKWSIAARTDASWKASESGYRDTGTWTALMFGGERVDGSLVPVGFSRQEMDARKWSPVAVVDVKGMTATPQMCESNVVCRRSNAVSVKPLGNGSWLVDMGRTLTGWFSMKMPKLAKGQEVKIEYADALEFDGSFKGQNESDVYIAAGRDGEAFCNKFNHHAYRYVRLSNIPVQPSLGDMTALQISGGYKETSSFACSDKDLNAIHDMLKYTLRCLNFSGYMVDCPHIERTGYGGDGNSSTMIAQTIYDLAPAYYNWLTAWGDVIGPDGSLPYVAPAGGGGGGPWWCAFLVEAPWKTWLNYADNRMLAKRYADMKLWLEYVDKNSQGGLLHPWPDTSNRMWFLGDWLAPAGVDVGGQSVELVANCVVSDCLATMVRAARALGNEDDARMYEQKRLTLNKLIHKTFFHADSYTYGNGTPLDMSYAMLVGAVPEDIYNKVSDKLIADSYGKYKGHIAVGLMGVPIFTTWAIRNHKTDLVYDILKKRDYPGYLYMIDNGATATWEYWNGERSHVHNCYNGIGTWFYEALGGIVPDENAPGYKHFTIDPQYTKSLTWVKAEKETPYGLIAVRWNFNGNAVKVALDVPASSTATFKLPAGYKSATCNGKRIKTGASGYELKKSGHYELFIHF